MQQRGCEHSKTGDNWDYVNPKRRVALGLVTALAAASLMVPLLTAGVSSAATHSSRDSVTSFPRNETLYTSGTSYSAPTIWNPMDLGNYATGTQGLLYETLFLYNPLNSKNPYMPWLARGGVWTDPGTYKITLRNGLTWSDGSALTSADVAYTIMLAKTNPAVPYSNLGPFIKSVSTPNSQTVVVNFKSGAYTVWANFLWSQPIINKAVWSTWTPAQQVTDANTSPIGSGPMLLDSAATTTQSVAYTVNPHWWGIADLGLNFRFKYLVDVVNGSNNVELGQLLESNIDLSNNFLPGISQLISSPAATGKLNASGGTALRPTTRRRPTCCRRIRSGSSPT